MVSRGFISTVLFVIFISVSFTNLNAQELWDHPPSLPKEPYDIRIRPITVDTWLRSVPLKSQDEFDSAYIKLSISVYEKPYYVHVLKVDSAGMFEWSRTYGNDSTWDYGSFICQDADGGYVITGNSVDTLDEWRWWIQKIDSTGSMRWKNKYKLSDHIISSYIQLDNPGYLLALPDNMLWSIDNSGATRWASRLLIDECTIYSQYIDRLADSNFLSVGYGICVDSIWFNYAIVFDSLGNIHRSIFLKEKQSPELPNITSITKTSTGGYLLSGDVNDQLWLGMLDSLGDTVWTRTYGKDEDSGTDVFVGHSIESTDGNFIISSMKRTYRSGMMRAQFGIKISKISKAGEMLWSRSYEEEEREYYPQGLVSTPDSCFMMAVCFNNSDWLVKFDDRGNPLWRRPLPYRGVNYMNSTTDGGTIIIIRSDPPIML